MTLPSFVHVSLFISYHLVSSSIFALSKLAALLGCELQGEQGLTGQPPRGGACLLAYLSAEPGAAGLQTTSS